MEKVIEYSTVFNKELDKKMKNNRKKVLDVLKRKYNLENKTVKELVNKKLNYIIQASEIEGEYDWTTNMIQVVVDDIESSLPRQRVL